MILPERPALPPEQFNLTAAEEIRLRIAHEGPGSLLDELDNEFDPSVFGPLIGDISEHLVPIDLSDNDRATRSTRQRAAVRTSGYMALHAFYESNLPEPIASETLNIIRVLPLPQSLQVQDEERRARAFSALGTEGILNHREVRQLADTLWGHHFETTYDKSIADSATDSLGFVLYLLDMGWGIARQPLVAADNAAAAAAEVAADTILGQLDDQAWDSFLRNPTQF